MTSAETVDEAMALAMAMMFLHLTLDHRDDASIAKQNVLQLATSARELVEHGPSMGIDLRAAARAGS